MLKIGDTEVVLNTTFVVKNDEIARIEDTIQGLYCIFEIVFRKGTKENAGHTSWKGNGNLISIECTGWDGDLLGSSLIKRAYVGKINDKDLSFQIGHHMAGADVHQITFQVHLGGQNG